jgi:hypothetical protein
VHRYSESWGLPLPSSRATHPRAGGRGGPVPPQKLRAVTSGPPRRALLTGGSPRATSHALTHAGMRPSVHPPGHPCSFAASEFSQRSQGQLATATPSASHSIEALVSDPTADRIRSSRVDRSRAGTSGDDTAWACNLRTASNDGVVEDDGNRQLIRSLLAIDRCCGKRFVYPRYSGRPPVSLLRRFKRDMININRVLSSVSIPSSGTVLFQYTNDYPVGRFQNQI